MAERGPDRHQLRDKIQFIRAEVEQLERIQERGKEAFEGDRILHYAAVRSIQVAVEAMLDAANHFVARERLDIPKTYRDALRLLVDAGILPNDRAESFDQMVRLRNRAVHLYDKIEPAEVFSIIEDDLADFETFIGAITTKYFTKPDTDDQDRGPAESAE